MEKKVKLGEFESLETIGSKTDFVLTNRLLYTNCPTAHKEN